MKPEDLQADFTPRLETVNVKAPPPRKGGAKVRFLSVPFLFECF
jgi:electron transfer flavoprotein beta subunit